MIKQKIIKNTLYSIVSYGYSAVVGFLLVPFVLKNLGINRYGIWSLITMITGYFSLIDLGIGQSFERYIAEYKAKNEKDKINYVVNSGLYFYFSLLLILSFLSLIVPKFLIKILKIPQDFNDEALFIFKWAIIYIGLSNIFTLFYNCLRGFQRMDITSKITIILTTLHALGVILFIKNNWGIKGLMVNNFLVYSIGGLISLLSIYKIFPEIKLDFLLFEKNIFKKLSKFGIKRWLTAVEEVITYQTDKFFISHFLNVGLVSIYQIGYTIPEKLANMIRTLNSAIVPASAELKAMNDKERLIKLHTYGLKIISTIAFPLMFFIIATAPLIINLWVGPGYEKSVIVLRLFSLIFLITFLSSNLTAILVGIEKPEFQMYAGIGQATLNLILTYFLIRKIGFNGVIIATLISISLSTFYLFAIYHNIFGIKMITTFKNSISIPFYGALLFSLILFFFNKTIVNSIKSLNILILFIEAVASFIIYFSFILISNWLKSLQIIYRGGLNYDKFFKSDNKNFK